MCLAIYVQSFKIQLDMLLKLNDVIVSLRTNSFYDVEVLESEDSDY